MKSIRTAERYARALLEQSREKNALEDVHQDMVRVEEILKQNKSLLTLLKTPLVHADKKQKVLTAVFGNQCHPITLSLFNLLVRKGREDTLPFVAASFIQRYREHNGILSAELQAARPMDEDALAAILSRVESMFRKKVLLDEKVNPALLGGFVLKVGDRYFDGSVSARINRLKQEFRKNPYIVN